ncbi:MAG: lactate utilization protein [Alphaproteobacteria bacterium]|jgi:L-lactate dehydrogenase complex protein LldG|nr:lactate utilization protein [Alphaproteobacteria bacterium]
MSSNSESARDGIIGAVRRSLGRGALGAESEDELEKRLRTPDANTIPARSNVSHAEQVDMFTRYAEGVSATVSRVSRAAEVPAAVSDYLAEHNLPSDVVMAPDEALDAYPWGERPMLGIRRGRAEDADAVSVTGAEFGFAETGTLMMTSGAHHPSTLNFMPDTHVVILPANRIVGAYEEGWQALRERTDADGTFMPRTVNMITGPSRTGDIEQRMQLGAHGPRRLHIVIVDEA